MHLETLVMFVLVCFQSGAPIGDANVGTASMLMSSVRVNTHSPFPCAGVGGKETIFNECWELAVMDALEVIAQCSAPTRR